MKIITKLFVATLFILLSASPSKASDYYWVGGSGSWDDSNNHWATSSGGTSFYDYPPNMGDNIYFDQNSFHEQGDIVYIESDGIYCDNLTVSTMSYFPIFTDANAIDASIYISGSLVLDSNMVWAVYIPIYLESYQPTAIIQAPNIFFQSYVTIFPQTGSQYSLQSDLVCLDLEIDGPFSSNSYNILCDSGTLRFNGLPIVADLGSSILYSNQGIIINGPLSNDSGFDAGYASFYAPAFYSYAQQPGFMYHQVDAYSVLADHSTFDSLSCYSFSGDSNTVRSLLCDSSLDLMYSGNGINTFNNLSVRDTLTIEDKWSIDNLNFTAPNAVLNFTGYPYLYISGELNYKGPGTMNGNGGSIYKEYGSLCMDSVLINDMYVTGGARFYAGVNASDDTYYEGWLPYSCNSDYGLWPGDANNDKVVDNLDVLDVGVNYGLIGYPGDFPDLEWTPKIVEDWGILQSNGQDMKYVDCNGDSQIDSFDLDVINLNYGDIHPTWDTTARKAFFPSAASLTVKTLPDTITEGSHINIDIGLGTLVNPIDSMYGIAFSIAFDPALIDPTSVNADFSNSWLGTVGTDMIGFMMPLVSEGRIDFALTRIDHQNAVAGNGHLLSLSLTAADNISAASHFEVQAIRVTSDASRGILTPLNGSVDSVTIKSVFASIPEHSSNNYFTIYPNPADGTISLNTNARMLKQVEIYNLQGRIVFSGNEAALPFKINSSAFPDGIYQLRCLTDEGVYNRMIEIIHP